MELIDILQQHYYDTISSFPKLQEPYLITGIGIIDGEIDVIDSNGFLWDTYGVRILFPPDYPRTIPRLIETTAKIIRHVNWHINDKGVCCLGTDARQYRDMSDSLTLKKWINLFVVPYFANHVRRVEFGSYANGEHSHGVQGLIEDYSAWLQITEKDVLLHRLKLMAGIKSQNKNASCFCESGKKYKRCYEKEPNRHLSGIPWNLIVEDIKKIEQFATMK